MEQVKNEELALIQGGDACTGAFMLAGEAVGAGAGFFGGFGFGAPGV